MFSLVILAFAAVYLRIDSMSVGNDLSLMTQNMEALAAGEGGGGGRCPSGGRQIQNVPFGVDRISRVGHGQLLHVIREVVISV